jgi:hypothetical protein
MCYFPKGFAYETLFMGTSMLVIRFAVGMFPGSGSNGSGF